MLNNTINIILIWIISFVPIVIWAYIFSYIDNNSLNKKRFFVWIISWMISVFPILYMEKLISNTDFRYLHIFSLANSINSFFSSLEFSLSMWLFLIIFSIISLSLIMIFFRNRKSIFILRKNTFSIFIFIFFIAILTYFISKISFLNIQIWESLEFSWFIFDSIKLIIFYYLVVAFLEESSKHFNFLRTDIFKINSIKTWVLYSIFVALWFSFIENILYINNIYISNWFNNNIVQIYLFRSVFSVIVHILCSSVLAYFFMKSFLLYKENKLNISYIKILVTWFFISITLHIIFDVSLSLNFSFIIIIYMIIAYLYIWSIFYKD